MRIRLHLNKSVHESAAAYYEESKEAGKKAEGLEKAIAETKAEIKKAKEAAALKQKNKAQPRTKREREWYEKFHWFKTSGGRLAVGGRDAKQNDLLFAKHMEDNDLFFHADIQGGSALFLKDGVNASEAERRECAQFAASFSNAWKNANASVDAYSVKKEQLSKHAHGGYIGAGGFAIKGEREWHKATQLGLKAGILEGKPAILPERSPTKLQNETILRPSKSGEEKGALAKKLAKQFSSCATHTSGRALGCHPDELLEVLPNGRSKAKRE